MRSSASIKKGDLVLREHNRKAIGGGRLGPLLNIGIEKDERGVHAERALQDPGVAGSWGTRIGSKRQLSE
jgi:hypothetical protein